MAPTYQMCFCELTKKGAWCFFCGAGISYPAGLPDYKGLVHQIVARTDPGFADVERQAYNDGPYDSTLDMLERRLVGHRLVVRCALADVLNRMLKNQPNRPVSNLSARFEGNCPQGFQPSRAFLVTARSLLMEELLSRGPF